MKTNRTDVCVILLGRLVYYRDKVNWVNGTVPIVPIEDVPVVTIHTHLLLMKPIAINSNSPIAKNSRTKPRSPTNSFKDEYSTINDDIEANNTGIKTITSTTAGATSSSSSNFVEVDLSDHEMEGGPVGSSSIGGDVDYDTDEGGSGSEDQYV